MMLVAFFLFVLIPGSMQEWPEELGPYEHEECLAVKEFLDRRGYEISSCELMPLPQPDAVYLVVPALPREHEEPVQ